jgi:hypothetical protein
MAHLSARQRNRLFDAAIHIGDDFPKARAIAGLDAGYLNEGQFDRLSLVQRGMSLEPGGRFQRGMSLKGV